MRMRPVDNVWTPRQRRPLLVLAVVLATLLILSGVVFVAVKILADLDQTFSCSPPSQEEMKVQEAFVRSHISDAQDLDWEVWDCDDRGVAELEFTTDRTPGGRA